MNWSVGIMEGGRVLGESEKEWEGECEMVRRESSMTSFSLHLGIGGHCSED